MAKAEPFAGKKTSYNERLFRGGVRKKLHSARFLWVQKTLDRLGARPVRVLELGCYDGRAVEFLPAMPDYYLGLDADWESALTLANERWGGRSNLEFRKCLRAEDMGVEEQVFDTALSLETLEHIPPELVEPYIDRIAATTTGLFLVTVPNEKGLVFAAKHILKVLVVGSPERYSLKEFFWQTLGCTDKVARREHKGFDYAKMVRLLSEYFDIERVEGIPFAFLPACLNFGVGIVCLPKEKGRF